MVSFNDLWEHCEKNCKVFAQEKSELEHAFNLMKGCESYLEIGTSEGNSLYVLGHALKEGAEITYIDANEIHTRDWRQPKEKLLLEHGYKITAIHGNTHHHDSVELASKRRYDIVFIDAGHTYDDVVQDTKNYAPLADKYILFHDVMMPEVMKAFREYAEGKNWYCFINSKKYGFGVVKV